MARADEDRSRLVAELHQLIDEGAVGEGTTPAPFPGLDYYRASGIHPRSPMLLDPTLCLVASGEKKAI